MRFPRVLLFAALAPAWAGCGSTGPSAQLSGTVTFDGAPVKAGTIRFIPVAGGDTGVAAIADGKYDTAVAPNRGGSPGEVTIAVSGLGDPTADYPAGKPLFNDYAVKATIPDGKSAKDVAVPKSAAEGLPTGPPTPP